MILLVFDSGSHESLLGFVVLLTAGFCKRSFDNIIIRAQLLEESAEDHKEGEADQLNGVAFKC